MKKQFFKDYVIVSCGTLSPELNYLKKSKFLDAKKILYTKPVDMKFLQNLNISLKIR